MTTITISKKEYEKLVEAKLRYDYLRQGIEDDLFCPPPTHNTREVVRQFTGIKKYNKEFLKSLEKGLRRSAHFRV